MFRLFLPLTAMLFLTGLAAAGTPAQAQEQRLLAIARDTATIAGGGRYCGFDPEQVEEFIAKAEARLSVLARDDYEKVLARLEFKNLLDATSAREPAGGCAAFQPSFERALKSLQ